MQTFNTLEKTIPQGKMLKNALRIMKKRSNRIPTWSAVAEICLVGSHHAYHICHEIGVNPDAHRFEEVKLDRPKL